MQKKLWNRYFILITVMMLFIGLSMQILNPAMPLYLKSLGGSASLGGLANGLIAISALLFRPVAGLLSEKIGRRRVIAVGALIFAAGVFMINLLPTIAMALTARFVQGIGFAMVGTAAGTVVTDVVPHDQLHKGISLYGLSNSLSIAFGSTIALALIGSLGYWWLFTAVFVILLLILLQSFSLNYEKDSDRSAAEAHAGENSGLFGSLFEKSALTAALIQFILALGTSSAMSFVTYYGVSLGIKDVGYYFTACAVFMVIAQLVVSKLIEHLGLRRLMISASLLAAVGFFYLAFARTLWGFLIVGAVNGIIQGILWAALNIVAVRDCDKSRRGAANATYLCAIDLGMGIGSILWGKTADLAGFQAVFIGSSICFVLALLVVFFKIHKDYQAV